MQPVEGGSNLGAVWIVKLKVGDFDMVLGSAEHGGKLDSFDVLADPQTRPPGDSHL